MNINALIQTERPTVAALVNGFRSGELFVDQTFQRKLVWIERQKVRLIETVLMEFPMPEIYLWQQPADSETGTQQRSVVDGQQRLTTLRQFVANEWPLKTKHLDDENKHAAYSGKYWKDLDADIKGRIWDYVLNVRVIPATMDRDTIVTVFLRLNETDKSLNPQEVRNAEFDGLLIRAAEEIANLKFWREREIFAPAQIRRMIDIEFASSMLVYLRRGSIEENSKTLNETYDLFNDVYTERVADVRVVSEFLSRLDGMLTEAAGLVEMFTKPIHLFTLFCVSENFKAQNKLHLITSEKLLAFVARYEDVGAERDALIDTYRNGSRARTRSKSSRDARLNSLSRWLER